MRFQRFWGFMELFSLRKIHRICPRHRGPGPSVPAHESTNFIKRWSLASGLTVQIKPSKSVSRLFITDPMAETAGSGRGRRIVAERGSSPEFDFSRATVVGFRWGLLLRDHSDEEDVFILTLIGGERQQSPTTVRRLDWCLATVRAASGEASTPRTCGKASLSSHLASRLTNCSDRWRKTLIWWLPRVRRVLGLRLKICTIYGAIYRGF
jgi:hypothetical protein